MTVMGKKSCSVLGCKPPKTSGKFYRFPKDPTLANEWHLKCGRISKAKEPFVCDAHFSSNMKLSEVKYELLGYSAPKNYRGLTIAAVPDINLPEELPRSPRPVPPSSPSPGKNLAVNKLILTLRPIIM